MRELNKQFGNLGLAAAAYNAGPRRVSDWLAKKRRDARRDAQLRGPDHRPPDREWVGAENDVEMTLMPAKAPCVEVAEAVEAQAKVVRCRELIAELAAQASQTRDKKDAVKPDEEVADVADRGWRARATGMVRDVLKRLAEQRVAARIAARNEIRAAAKAAVEAKAAAKFAAWKAEQERLSARPERRAEVKTFIPPAGRTPPVSAEKDMQRSAVRVVSTADVRDPTRPDGRATLVDGNRVEPAKTDGSKPDPDKLDPPKAEEAKARSRRSRAAASSASPDIFISTRSTGRSDGRAARVS